MNTISISVIACMITASKAWTSMGAGGMAGVTYASGTIYNVNTMCPSNVNQGYVCDGRNFGDKYLSPSKMSTFCSGYVGTNTQFGFGHGVTADQKCGQCAQIRVPRTDGSYNYMTVMMVDHFTWSMEVGTTEIAHLVSGTRWVVGDRADFEYRVVGDYDCYATFDDNDSTYTPPSTPSTTTTTTTTKSSWNSWTTTKQSSGGSSSNSGCSVSSNWGSMKINPYWGSSTSSMYALIYNPPMSITSFAIRGADQSTYQSCVYQNHNAFQCTISGGALKEPASVVLNGGAYTGNNIIVSMTGSSALYPLSSCSASAAFENGEDTVDGEPNHVYQFNAFEVIAIVLVLLFGICVAVLFFCKAAKKRVGSKQYFKDDDKEEVPDEEEIDIEVSIIEEDGQQMITTA